MEKQLGRYHIPENWQWVSLEDLVVFSKGRKPVLTSKNEDGVVPYLDIEAFEKQQIKQYARPEDSTLIDENSIAMVWDGARSGHVFKGKEGALGSTLMKIKPFIVQELYIYYYLTFTSGYLKSNTKGTGIPHVNPQVLFKMKVPLPPIEEQSRIVQKIEESFSELDDSVKKLNEMHSKLHLYQQAVYNEAYGNLNAEVVPLSEICSITSGVTKGRNLIGKETVELPYLRVANVQDGYLNLNEVKTIKILTRERERYVLVKGDVLYTEGGDRDKLGRGTVWRGEIKECIHQNHVFRARAKSSKYNPNYISYFSKTNAARHYFFKNGKQTTNLASINISILSNLMIPIVPIEDQLKVVEKIDSQLSIYNHSVLKIRSTLAQIQQAKQGILKKAFYGHLVTQNLSDETVTNLLDNITIAKQKFILASQKAKKTRLQNRRKIMSNKDIIELLESAGQPISAKDLWESSKYKGDIEQFYSALKRVSHLIQEDPKCIISLNRNTSDEN